MKARFAIALIVIYTVLLSACAPAAPKPSTPAGPAVVAEAPSAGAPASAGSDAYSATEAPAAAEAPAPELGAAEMPAAGVSGSPPAWPSPTRAAPGIIPVAPPPTDNYFRNYGVNPFMDAREDHLSTFALDVDTAAYTVARRYVMDGNLPPADAVRVEEFINYFRQDYPSPPGVAFGIYADGAPSPFQSDGTYLLRFGIQGYQVPEESRKPAVLTFVIDISGSMAEENRLELVKQSLRLLVERLRPADRVAIVVYGSDARVALYPTSGEDRRAILQVIDNLWPEDATNAEAGLRLGYSLAFEAFQPGAINRVILCSDGVANVGATSPEAILESIRGYAEQGITLTTIGFGMGNFNDVLMEQLADGGDGSYAYVDDIDEAGRLFVDDLTATLQVIALDAKVQVDFNPENVERYRLLGYENRAVADSDFRNNEVDAGEIGAGHSVTALYAVQLRPGAEGRIATAQLRWEDPAAHAVQEINGNFNTWDLAPAFESASPRYQLDVVVAQYAELLRLSPWAAGTSLRGLLDHAVRIAGLLPGDPEVAEFVTLVSRAAQINTLIEWAYP